MSGRMLRKTSRANRSSAQSLPQLLLVAPIFILISFLIFGLTAQTAHAVDQGTPQRHRIPPQSSQETGAAGSSAASPRAVKANSHGSATGSGSRELRMKMAC